MKKLLRKYPETVLITLAIAFIAIIILYFTWGVGAVVGQVDRVEDSNGAGGGTASFNLQGAQQLNLRGLVSQ